MAFTLINASTGGVGVNSSTSGAISTIGADLLVFSAGWYDGVTTDVTVADNQTGNTWNALTKQFAGSIASRIWWCVPIDTDASHTVTASGASTFSGSQLTAWSGANSSPVDQQNGATGSGTTQATGSITPSQDNCLIIAHGTFAAAPQASYTIDSGMTVTGGVSFSVGVNEGSAQAYKVQTTAAAINPTWDPQTIAMAMCATIASFKIASASTTFVPLVGGYGPGMGLAGKGGLVASDMHMMRREVRARGLHVSR